MVNNTQTPPVFPSVPVGRLYRSGRSDVSAKARSLLFESRAEALLKRRKAC